MKKRLTFLFALLCVSVMTFAIDWSGYNWVDGSGNQFKVGAESVDNMPSSVVNVQQPGWASEWGIYMTFPSDDQLACSKSAAISGSGMVVYLSNFLGAEETEVTVTWNGGGRTFYVYNSSPMVLPATKASAPAVAASRVRAIYSQYALNTGMTMQGWSNAMTKTDVNVVGRTFPSFKFGNYLGLGYGATYVSNMDNIHLDIWTENSFNIDFYLISPGSENAYTIALTGAQWNSVDIPLSTFTADKTRVHEFKFANASVADQTIFLDNIYFYANSDLPDQTPSEIEDTNFALRTNGSIAFSSSNNGENYPAKAIDGDNGTLWESSWDSDPQSLVVDFGQRRIFNNVKILWGNQWPTELYLETSNNGADWTEAKHVTGNTDHANQEQNFELNSKVTARYLRFRGIHRGNGYGYTIKEIDAFLAGVPVLTSVDISSDKSITKVGEYATLIVAPKDQNSSAIVAELAYSVSPADLGHVTDGKYYPDKYGLATITVTATAGGEEVSNSVQVWGVVSNNLALNNALAEVGTWYDSLTSAKAVDGDDGTEWQGSTANGNVGGSQTYDAWMVVDLMSNYNLQLITIHFEGACSDAYKLFVSTDNTNWTEAYSYTGTNGINNHTDYISTANLYNADNARYVKFISTKAATEWGVKIKEMEIYGAETSSNKTVAATISPAAAGSVTITAGGSPVTEVESGTSVTFAATPADGYDFVNWTQGGVEISTSTEYTTTITSNTALVANFEAHRTEYCATPVTDTQSRTLYLTIAKTENANEYKILFEGSTNNKLRGDNVYVGTGLQLRNVNGEATYTFGSASGQWHVSSEGFGSAYITFTATDFRQISFVNKGVDMFRDQSGGGNDLTSFNAFPDASVIKWDATCTDNEAPVLAAPVATPLSGTSVRLALSATDNMAALLTYAINYKPAGSDAVGTDVEVAGTAGETTYQNIKGLAAGTRYQFSVTVSDGINESDAQVCYATPSMATAPVPTHNADLVRSVYSDKYESALAHDFIKNNWAWTTYAEQIINGDHLLVYTSDPETQAQMPDIAWGDSNDGVNAIIAKDGLNDGTNKGLDVRNMAYMHVDIWSAIATNYPELRLNDTEAGHIRLDGSGWQSFDLPLASLTDDQKTNIRWIKFIAFRTPNPEEIAIDNVYFWQYGAQSNVDKWSTFAAPVAVKVPNDVTVYTAEYQNNNGDETLTLHDAGKVIPANKGVILEGNDASTSYAFTLATSGEAEEAASNFTSNCLVGCATRTDISDLYATYDIFCMRRSESYNTTGFFLYTGQYIPAGKAYLKLSKNPAAGAPASRRVRFVYDTATAIDNNAEATVVTKFIENGQLFIRRGDAIYTTQGVRVE